MVLLSGPRSKSIQVNHVWKLLSTHIPGLEWIQVHPRSLTARPWKMVVERRSGFLLGETVTFQGRLLLNFEGGNIPFSRFDFFSGHHEIPGWNRSLKSMRILDEQNPRKKPSRDPPSPIMGFMTPYRGTMVANKPASSRHTEWHISPSQRKKLWRSLNPPLSEVVELRLVASFLWGEVPVLNNKHKRWWSCGPWGIQPRYCQTRSCLLEKVVFIPFKISEKNNLSASRTGPFLWLTFHQQRQRQNGQATPTGEIAGASGSVAFGSLKQ